MHVLLVINNLSPGTGPFQRIIKFEKSVNVSVVSLSDNQVDLEDISKQFGVDVSHVNLYGLNAKNKLNALNKLLRLVKKIRPDIIQSAHTLSDFLCISIKYIFKIPVISFEATLISRWPPIKRYMILIVHAMFDAVVCVSHDVNKKNSNLNSFFRKITNRHTIYNGVDIELIDSLDTEPKHESKKITIGYTGDLKPTKNLPILFYAFKECYKVNTNLRLLIIGTGPEYKRLKKLALDLNIEESVEFTGQVSRLKVFEMLKSIDIFAMPTLMEGLCESVVQAMASKTPVVVSDISQNQELVSHNKTGLLFTSGDSISLSYEILRIVNSEVNVTTLIDNARIYAEKFLNINNIVIEYTELYKEYLR